MSTLQPIVRTCKPRSDVLSGRLADQHFAAQLDQIVRNPQNYPIYGDPDDFFALTYPTSGLKSLLSRVFGRLSGGGSVGAEQSVIRLETSFGGGKTHSLIALYHLAKGARPKNLDEFVDPDLLSEQCKIAAVVGDAMDPLSGLRTGGATTYTMWGEIAAQLGPDAYEEMRQSDQNRGAPGKGVWERVCGDTPTIIVMDELAHHLRQLTSSGAEEVRRQAEAMPVFLKNLFEFAAGVPNVAVVVTLATRSDAYSRETDELSTLLDEASARFSETLDDAHSIVTRSTTSALKPAEDQEIAEILKRRLFEYVDPAAVDAAADAYREYYENLKARGEQLAGGAESPVSYSDAVRSSYPFHPELVRVLDKRLGTIPNFQRARGALKLLAGVVADLWSRDSDAEVLNVADIGLSTGDTLSQLTVGLGRADFENVGRVDVAASDSHASYVDSTRFAGREPYASRAATTVFLHSLELASTGGATRPDYLLGSLKVGDEPEVIAEALAELEKLAWHLSYDGARWRFLVEPNANRIIAEEMRNVPNIRVNQELSERIEKAFPNEGQVKVVRFPISSADVPDEARLQLVVLHHDDLHVTERSAMPPPTKVADILDNSGAGGNIRSRRNGVTFVVAEEDAVDAMRERVRASIAASALVNDSQRMRDFSAEVQKRIRQAADTAKLEARVAVARCYKHLYRPAADQANRYLAHVSLGARSQGEADRSLTSVVLEVLKQEGKIRTERMATSYLKQRAWPRGAEEVTTQAVAEAFWRDHGTQMVLDPTILREAIRDGVRNGDWVYFDAQAQRAYGPDDSQPSLEFSRDSYLYTKERAEELGLLRRPVRWEDISQVLSSQITGADLRSSLEQELLYEPSKGDVTGVLSRVADGGDAAYVVVVKDPPEPGAKALTPSQIRENSLDNLVVLTPAKAEGLGIQRPGARRTTAVEANGSAGVAFQSLQDKAIEVRGASGLASLSISASAEPGEGPKDISMLGKALGMLPRFEITVDLRMMLDFRGLNNGAEINLSGPSSDYQRVEDSLLGLARAASGVGGTLRLDLKFDSPCDPVGDEYERIRRMIVELDPGEVRLKGVMAWPEA